MAVDVWNRDFKFYTKENSPIWENWDRLWGEHITNKKLAKVLEHEQKIVQKWKEIPNKLKSKENMLRNKLLEYEIKRIEEKIQTKEFTEEDLLFLEKDDNVCHLSNYREHRLSWIKHSEWEAWVITNSWYAYKPKYTPLYEMCKDQPLISEETKKSWRRDARYEIVDIIYKEIENDTILYWYWEWFVKHVSEYISQTEFANMLIDNGNSRVHSDIGVLVRCIDYFDELDESIAEKLTEAWYWDVVAKHPEKFWLKKEK